jgi:arabinogalactan endo-1,4-beta-galactosidase
MLGMAAAVGGAAAIGAIGGPGAAPAHAEDGGADPAVRRRARRFRTSLSVSPFTESVLAVTALQAGHRTATTVADVQKIFNRAGATEVFVRVATVDETPGNRGGGATRAIERARLAKRLGMPLNPELGLWAYYGDIALQPSPDFRDYPQISLPGPWMSLNIDQMATAMRAYGRAIAQQILSTGVDVNVWDIGNEIEMGIAGVAIRSFSTSDEHGWSYQAPDAVNPAIGQIGIYDLFGMSESDRTAWLSTNLWPYVGRLLVATAEGVRSVDRHARFATHTSVLAPQLPGVLPAFWQAMENAGFHSQELGASYYPTSIAGGDQLQALKDSAQQLRDTFGRPLFLAETSYPSAQITAPAYASWNNPVPGYPLTPQGQYEFYRDLAQWGASTGLLSGIRQWAPDFSTAEWIQMSCFDAPVDGVSVAKPVLTAVRDGLKRV